MTLCGAAQKEEDDTSWAVAVCLWRVQLTPRNGKGRIGVAGGCIQVLIRTRGSGEWGSGECGSDREEHQENFDIDMERDRSFIDEEGKNGDRVLMVFGVREHQRSFFMLVLVLSRELCSPSGSWGPFPGSCLHHSFFRRDAWTPSGVRVQEAPVPFPCLLPARHLPCCRSCGLPGR